MAEPRRLSLALLIGILALPALFVWLVLRRGYSADLRSGAFLYFGFGIAGALAAAV